MGGETMAGAMGKRSWVGLPPRGRGNRHGAYAEHLLSRSTPAWAGKPWPWAAGWRSAWVYPRVGGETVASIVNIR